MRILAVMQADTRPILSTSGVYVRRAGLGSLDRVFPDSVPPIPPTSLLLLYEGELPNKNAFDNRKAVVACWCLWRKDVCGLWPKSVSNYVMWSFKLLFAFLIYME